MFHINFVLLYMLETSSRRIDIRARFNDGSYTSKRNVMAIMMYRAFKCCLSILSRSRRCYVWWRGSTEGPLCARLNGHPPPFSNARMKTNGSKTRKGTPRKSGTNWLLLRSRGKEKIWGTRWSMSDVTAVIRDPGSCCWRIYCFIASFSSALQLENFEIRRTMRNFYSRVTMSHSASTKSLEEKLEPNLKKMAKRIT